MRCVLVLPFSSITVTKYKPFAQVERSIFVEVCSVISTPDAFVTLIIMSSDSWLELQKIRSKDLGKLKTSAKLALKELFHLHMDYLTK